MKKYKYKFSIIIPVYNVEKYIKETIESVIKQTIGFKNIQIILINDGSTDSSEEVCLKFVKKYPNNIIYKKQKNSGVSTARNYGLTFAEGKYVNFLDSDDLWGKRTLKNVWRFFEANYKQIDLVACRIKFFEMSNRYHPLDFKFTNERVVDVVKDYQFIQLNGPTVFVKNEVAQNFLFDEKLKYGEDPFWVNQIIINKGKYGLVPSAVYMYRKRKTESSSTDRAALKKEFYLDPIEHYLIPLNQYVQTQNKSCKHFIQALTLYELYWKMRMVIPENIFTKAEKKKYVDEIYTIIKNIDDEVILTHPHMSTSFKFYLLRLKHGKKFIRDVKLMENTIGYKKAIFKSENVLKNISVTNVVVINNNLVLYGKIIPLFCNMEIKYFVKKKNTNKKIYATIYKAKNRNIYFADGTIVGQEMMFKIELPITKDLSEYEHFVVYEGLEAKTNYKMPKSLSLSDKYNQYRVIEKKCIIKRNGSNLLVIRGTGSRIFKYEIECCMDLIKKRKFKTIVKRVLTPGIRLYRYLKRNTRLKKIILFESNPDYTDNAKALFDYMIKQGVNKKYKLVWFIKKDSNFDDVHIENVEFVKFFGLTNVQRSKKAKYYYRHAKIIIDGNKYIKKFNKKQIRIHLNHGSPLKNAAQYNLNIGKTNYVIVQSSFFKPIEAEVRGITEDKIVPLGFPRNDILYKKEKSSFFEKYGNGKKILWLPTYRNHIASGNSNNKLKYGLGCINTKEELLQVNNALKKGNITLFVKFHPAEKIDILESMALSNICILKDEDLIKENISLYQTFSSVDALITDYSSVYFDFCLTKKNIGLAISDIEDYIKENGNFQMKYEDAVVGSYMYNNKDLLEFIDDVANDRDKTYKERMKVVKKYDDYRDGKATERVYEFIKKFL